MIESSGVASGLAGVELRSDRLVLRRHAESDLDAAAAMWSHPDVVRHIGGQAFTREEVWHRILRYAGHWTLRPFGYWAIAERDSGRFVGEIGLADWKRASLDLTSPEAGWVLVPDVHGRGYASEALLVMLDWADQSGLAETCCVIQRGNSASIRLAENFAYRLAGSSEVGKPLVFVRRRIVAAFGST